MPAEDRARKPGALPSAPEETGVSMRALLASRAAADAVSTPPSDPSDGEARRAEDGERTEPDGEDEPARAEVSRAAATPLSHQSPGHGQDQSHDQDRSQGQDAA